MERGRIPGQKAVAGGVCGWAGGGGEVMLIAQKSEPDTRLHKSRAGGPGQ